MAGTQSDYRLCTICGCKCSGVRVGAVVCVKNRGICGVNILPFACTSALANNRLAIGRLAIGKSWEVGLA